MKTDIKKEYIITWRHRVTISAYTFEEANDIWDKLNLGSLDRAEVDEEILTHDYIERITFEDEDFNDYPFL